MGSQYRLGDADRERLGCPEWITLDLLDVSIDDVSELSDRFLFDLEDWPEPLVGPKGENGERKTPTWQFHASVWMALHLAGTFASWDDVGKVAILRVQSRDDDPGKAPDPESGSSGSTPPESSGSSTTPPSSTSSPD